MPAVSKKQLGLMFASAAGKSRKKGGPSKKVAKEFIKATPHGGKGLPMRMPKSPKGY